MQVPLRHHVYSSDGGYRTTYASPEVSPAAVRALEAFASAAQQVYSHGRSYSCLRLDDGQLAISCAFVHGADHVGRRRLCSHSILVPVEACALEGFNPAAPPPHLFVDEQVPVERPGPYLRPTWDVPEDETLDAARQAALQTLDAASAAILSGLLVPGRMLVISGSLAEGMRRLGSAAWLLPKELREQLLYRSGAWRPGELAGLGKVGALLLPAAAGAGEYAGGEFVRVDLDAPPQEGDAAAFRDPYVRMLWELRRSGNGEKRLRIFLLLLGNFPGPVQPSLDQQACLVEGYRLAEPALLEEDQFQAAVRYGPRLIGAISPMARSGRMALAEGILEMLEDALSSTDRQTVKQELVTLNKEMKENFYLQGLELGKRLEQYGRKLREAATRSDVAS